MKRNDRANACACRSSVTGMIDDKATFPGVGKVASVRSGAGPHGPAGIDQATDSLVERRR